MLKLIQHSSPLRQPLTWRSPASTLIRPLILQPNKLSRSFFTSTNPTLNKSTSRDDAPTKISNDGKVVVDISEHPIIKRIPKFLHPYTVRFMNAPVSHVTAFIILHEITAIAPLFGLWGLFSYYDYTPIGIPDFLIEKGTAFIDVMADRNGWTSLKSEEGAKMVLQGAAAYAIVKVLLPVRAAFSLLAMPWFARWFVIPFTRMFQRKPSQKARASTSSSNTTGSNFMATKKPETTPPADPKGQVWNQDLPSEPPQFKPKKSDPNRPSL